MNYRARGIGGDISVLPRAGGGTLVRCKCPLPLLGAPVQRV
jgi:signal transduction histidine kinase